MGERDPALIEGPDLIEREAAYIGSPGFWADLHAQVKGRLLQRDWTRQGGEAKVT